MQYLLGSHKGPFPPNFCRGCGREMRVSEKFLKFNENTGQEIYLRIAKCSAPWWSRLKFHDSAEQDECGDWLWV